MRKKSTESLTQQDKWKRQYDVLAESLSHPKDSVIGRLFVSGSLGVQAALFLEEFQAKKEYLKDIESDSTQEAVKIIAAGALQIEELRSQLKLQNELGTAAEENYQRVRKSLLEMTPLYLAYLESFRASLPKNRKLRTMHRFLSDLIYHSRILKAGLQASNRWN